ncbi:serine/threonine-protein kinase-like protein At1g28390 [Typha angustifolia]|uniref:serine/threonine-protein kinase-like protein At1g28390 n=1 Tax=Typha angustifolia TaxID=59011 RepID=UPI003C2E82DA
MKEFSYEAIEAATNGFSLERLIGKGSHGSVYKGILKDGKLVAVKKPSPGFKSIQGDSKLENEINILGSINSPSVVNLIGVSTQGHGSTDKLLIMEFMPNGSLHDLLHASSAPPGWPRRAAMALQIACAVLALHEASPSIIHRDIKSANILLDNKFNARLADFSLSVRDDKPPSMDPAVPAGTIGYLDPCYTESGQLGPKNDVFSFGVVLLELVSSRKVMDMDGDPSSIVAWAAPMIRAHRYADVCDRRVALADMEKPVARILNVAARCVSEAAERRPLMGEVVGELQGVVERIWRRPNWCPLRCVQAWRKIVKKRAMTTKIVCRDHLVVSGDNDCGDDEAN